MSSGIVWDIFLYVNKVQIRWLSILLWWPLLVLWIYLWTVFLCVRWYIMNDFLIFCYMQYIKSIYINWFNNISEFKWLRKGLCTRIHFCSYIHTLHSLDSELVRNCCRVWNKSYKYKSIYTVQLKHSKLHLHISRYCQLTLCCWKLGKKLYFEPGFFLFSD
jgi:hypothetical protein